MDRRTKRGWLTAGALGLSLGLSPGWARAQFGPTGEPLGTPAGGSATTVGSSARPSPFGAMTPMMAVNPYMNPYMNPYINPYASQSNQQVGAGNAALFFLSAQQMNGGIGSGKLGGPQATIGNRAAVAAESTRSGGANVPGGTASRYFGRDMPRHTAATRSFGRQNRHFPSPGK